MSSSQPGDEQHGIHWMGITSRIPLLHTRICWPEFIQGSFVAAATALALVPLMTRFFGLTFEEAIAMSLLHTMLISSSWMIFGEPYAPGWLTPALPFTLALVLSDSFPTPVERIQMMTAISLDFALLLIALGVSGVGEKLIKVVPEVLKGTIILGAAIAAFIKVFDMSIEDNIFNTQPIAATAAVSVSLLLAFSTPVHRIGMRVRFVFLLISFGLLPGFIVGAVAGSISGELNFDIQGGLFIMPFGDLFAKVSPFSIGWPSLNMFIQAFPLVLISYLLFFGDLLTGKAVLEFAAQKRNDEKLDINDSRTHITVAIRNVISALFAPFFPTQGVLWTGIHVVIVQRWQRGRGTMDSLFDGISSYYLLGIPVLLFLAPVVTAVKPMMPIALTVTLVLTGFACAYIAMGKAKDNTERGSMAIGAIFLALFDSWLGLFLAVAAVLLLVGVTTVHADAESAD